MNITPFLNKNKIIELDKVFFNKELIDILLFTSKNIIFNNYCDISKLSVLFHVLYPVFNVEVININELWNLENLKTYLSIGNDFHSGIEKQKLYIFLNLGAEHFEFIINQELNRRFIIIMNKDESILSKNKDLISKKIITYNIKSGKFGGIDNNTELNFKQQCILNWEEKIVSKLKKSNSIETGLKIIDKLICDLYEKSRNIYINFISGRNDKIKKILSNFPEKEKKNLSVLYESFIGAYYCINICIGSDGVFINYSEKFNHSKEEINKKKSNNNEILDNKIENAIDIEPDQILNTTLVNENLDSILNDQLEDLNQVLEEEKEDFSNKIKKIKREYQNISKFRNYFKTFTELLFFQKNLIKKPKIFDVINNPEQLYIELRLDPWSEEISSEFLQLWLLNHQMKFLKNRFDTNWEYKFHEQTKIFCEILDVIHTKQLKSDDFNKMRNKILKIYNNIDENEVNHMIQNNKGSKDDEDQNLKEFNKNITTSNEKNIKDALFFIESCINNKGISDINEFKKNLNLILKIIC